MGKNIMKNLFGSVLTRQIVKEASPEDFNNPKFWKKFLEIDRRAFDGYVFPKNFCLTIPEGVKKIGEHAFAFTKNLQSVVLPNSVQTIENDAFSNCDNLRYVRLPENLQNLGSGAFWNCCSLENVELPKTLTSISGYTFGKCVKLKSINIPSSVENIDAQAFRGCKKLTNVQLSENLKIICPQAFLNCSSLEQISLPKSLKEIGECAFTESGLKSLEVPENVKIGGGAFKNCDDLHEVVLHDGVKLVEGGVRGLEYDEHFMNNPKLSSVKLPSDLDTIPNSCFYLCTQLESIDLPESISDLRADAFRRAGLKNIHLPSNLKNIGSRAFEDCKLEEIEIPASVENFSFNSITGNVLRKLTIHGNPELEALHRLEALEFKDNKIDITLDLNSENIYNILHYSPDGLFYLPRKKLLGENVRLGKLLLAKDKSEYKIVSENVSVPNENDYYVLNITPKTQLERCYFNITSKYCDDRDLSEVIELGGAKNLVDCINLKEDGIIERIPDDVVLSLCPNSQINNCFLNNNLKYFYKLYSGHKLNEIKDPLVQANGEGELFKLYYSLGGFSHDIKSRDKAFRYVNDLLGDMENSIYEKFSGVDMNALDVATELANELHSRFTEMNLGNKPYNPIFAQFFMKYCNNDLDFMSLYESDEGEIFTKEQLDGLDNVEIEDEEIDEDVEPILDDDDDFDDLGGIEDVLGEKIYVSRKDYLAQAHNNFDNILKSFPNMSVNGNTERDLLTPKFVAEHVSTIEYENVNEGNENLANLIGKYGYDQNQFEEIQNLYEQSKKVKGNYVIKADKDSEDNSIQYRFLEKDDPLGFVIGNITNCCQHIGGAAESCVVDGFKNTNSGFLVFEKDIIRDGKPTGEKTVIGQAYIWYDPDTKTVCYDNIEVPRTVLKELRRNTKNNGLLNVDNFLAALERSADAVMHAMNNSKNTKVTKVTTGEGYNDLIDALNKKYKRLQGLKLPKNPSSNVYSDAETSQYVIRTYDQTTKYYERLIRDNLANANTNINKLRNQLDNEHVID